MKPKSIAFDAVVQISLLPSAKKALLEYARVFGCKREDENSRLQLGARWFIESSLTMIEAVEQEANRFVKYRDAENLDDSNYNEQLIGAAFEKWKAKFESDSNEEEN
jgi:hypothetical protein